MLWLYYHTLVTSDDSFTVIVIQLNKYIEYGGRLENNNII